ncbi:MAG: hypothetical protein AB7P02_03775 [Alphaproteobacteria bacterium]
MTEASRPILERRFSAVPTESAAVQAAVEQAALARDLDASGAARLGQAVEEVMAFIATRAPGSDFAVEVRDRRHAIEARARCRLAADAMHWFNMTQPIDVADPTAMQALELLMVSRLVDRLSVALDPDGDAVLTLEMARQYVASPAEPAVQPGPPGDPKPADAATMAGLARLFRRRFGVGIPPAFQADGLAVDLLASGELSALVATDAAGRVVAGLAWRARTPRLIEMVGPVSAKEDPNLAGRLVAALLETLDGTGAAMVVAEERGPGFPAGEFDCLGQLGSRPIHFRALPGDSAGVSWVDAASRPFLAVFYEGLALHRTLRDVGAPAATRPARALLAAEIDRLASRVTLRPLVDGADLPALIDAHVERFAGEGLDDFRFETDHGVPWQAALGRELLAAGFAPRVVLPYAGTGDVLVWERDWMPM